MADTPLRFYTDLADFYHLLFEDWEGTINRQAKILGRLISAGAERRPLKVLDCACGIGTQAIGFARVGHQVVASDLSPAAVARARREAQQRSLDIAFHVADMTDLREITAQDFDVVAVMDNALPHLSTPQLRMAAVAMASQLKPGGLFIASIRDYDQLILEKPTIQAPVFYGEEGNRRIVHQVWDWIADDRYIVHVYITRQTEGEWSTQHYVTDYRCLQRQELTTILEDVGFTGMEWLMPAQSGSYQPIVLARLPD